MKRCNSIAWLACAAAVATITLAPATPSQAQPAEASWARAPYAQYELDQMLAPIALYPDALLAQVLTAAIYPHQVADAGRFLQLNAGVSGDALADAVAHAPWDPSVQALTPLAQGLNRHSVAKALMKLTTITTSARWYSSFKHFWVLI